MSLRKEEEKKSKHHVLKKQNYLAQSSETKNLLKSTQVWEMFCETMYFKSRFGEEEKNMLLFVRIARSVARVIFQRPYDNVSSGRIVCLCCWIH